MLSFIVIISPLVSFSSKNVTHSILLQAELEFEYKQQKMLARTWQAKMQYLVWKIGRKLPIEY
jgi:hypothetical protein